MPGETEASPSAFTIDSLHQLLSAAIRDRDLLYTQLRQSDQRFAEERDRRYSEVNIEREKALKIKEEADSRALVLQAETQKYKDEKANELRSQIERERGTYATQGDLKALTLQFTAELKPIVDYVSKAQGRTSSFKDSGGFIVGAVGVVTAIVATAIAIFT